MDLSIVLLADQDVNKISDLGKIKGLNFTVVDKLESEAETYFNDMRLINYDMIDKFVGGEQWQLPSKKKTQLTFNYAGEVVYDLIQTYQKNDIAGLNKPKRTLNLTKAHLEALVANNAEIDPFPMAVSSNDNAYDADLINKINLLLTSIFNKENKLDDLYESICYDAYKYGSSFLYTCLDYDKTTTETPIKIRLISPKDVVYDPTACSIEEADYVIQKAKMRYCNLKHMYQYKMKEGDVEPEDVDMVDIKYYWFRNKNKKDNKTYWYCFVVYNKTWLKPIDEKGKFYPESVVFEFLPLVEFTPKVFSMNTGESVATEIIPLNVQYNQLITEEDWNFQKYVNKPLITNKDVNDIIGAKIPYGVQNVGTGESITPFSSDLVTVTELDGRKMGLKQQIKDVTGIDFVTMSGEKGRGIYSDKLMQTVKKMAETKPKLYEKHMLNGLERLAKKVLLLLVKHLDGDSIRVFDPASQKNIKISESNIYDGMYKLIVDTKDVNLIGREQRFEILTQFMQYSQGDPLLLYPMAMMTNNAIPHLFPEAVIGEWKKLYDQKVSAITMENEMAGQEMAPPTGATPPMTTPEMGVPPMEPQYQSIDEMPGVDEETFINQIEYYMSQLEEGGLTEDEILDIRQKFVEDQISEGMSKEEILMNMEEIVNQTVNIKSQGV